MQDFDFAREFDKDKNIINGMLCSFFKEKKCNQAMLYSTSYTNLEFICIPTRNKIRHIMKFNQFQGFFVLVLINSHLFYITSFTNHATKR